MTKKQQAQQLLNAINAAILEAVTSGALTASLSAGGGSKSYTRYTLAELRALRKETQQTLAAYNAGGRRPITMTGVRFA
jgi:hypothetical protein